MDPYSSPYIIPKIVSYPFPYSLLSTRQFNLTQSLNGADFKGIEILLQDFGVGDCKSRLNEKPASKGLIVGYPSISPVGEGCY